MPVDSADVVIIGGGVSGLSSAFWLAREGVDVVVVERGVVGWEASGRNGGMIGHRGTPASDGLGRASHELWPDMDAYLGYPTEFTPGRIDAALSGHEMEILLERKTLLEEMGIRLDVIDAATIRDLIPAASERIVGGLITMDGGHANPQRTVQAYAWALQDRGGRIYQHTAVSGFRTRGSRVESVITSRGEFDAGLVICAAGPQIPALCETVGAYVPLAQGRVEICVTAPIPPAWPGALAGNGLYGRQTRRGNLAYGGGPHEWIEVDMDSPDKPNTPVVRNISRRIAELFPGARDVPVIRSWAGVVELPRDHLPIIDSLEDPENLIVVSGAGAGFGRSPGTGKAVAELAMHGESSIPIEDLGLGRFGDISRDWRREMGWMPGREYVADYGYHPSSGHWSPTEGRVSPGSLPMTAEEG